MTAAFDQILTEGCDRQFHIFRRYHDSQVQVDLAAEPHRSAMEDTVVNSMTFRILSLDVGSRHGLCLRNHR